MDFLVSIFVILKDTHFLFFINVDRFNKRHRLRFKGCDIIKQI